jgi:FkbM family methyltransferase
MPSFSHDYQHEHPSASTQWQREPSVAGSVGYATTVLFEKISYPMGVCGASTVGRWLLAERPVLFTKPDGARFSFPAGDSYYGHYLYRVVPYEPEIAFLLENAGRDNLVDCGANFGYWPCFASCMKGKIIALELCAANFAWLSRNAKLNNDRFVAIHAAAWSDDGVMIEVSPGVRSHAGQSGRPGLSGVPSRSVDSIVAEYTLDPASTIVKVDCEGAEAQVLRGAAATAERGGLFVVEEHGKDPTCALARQLTDDGWVLHHWEHGWVPSTVAAIAAQKTDPRKGYNVLAHRPGVTIPDGLRTTAGPEHLV